ncbi:MAG: hypothetical protein R3B72_07825 [Polyangiaceae bacterium]
MVGLGSGALALLTACGGDSTGDPSGGGGQAMGVGGNGAGATGSGASTSSGLGGMGSGGMPGSGGAGVGDYPPGPYGTELGDTIAYLDMVGYESPTPNDPGPYVPVTMNDIRTSGSPFVLLHLAAMF